MGLRLRLVDVVEVVRHDEREARVAGEPEELRVEGRLLGETVVLQLEEEAALPEDVAVLAGQAAGQLDVVGLEGLRDLAAQAGGKPDQPLGVARQVLAVDPRLVVVAVEVGVGHEPAEVPVADEVRGQEDQVERLGVRLALAVAHRAPGDVRLHPDDRLDALGRRRLVEGDGAVQGAVVGDRERVEAQPLGFVHEVGDPAEPVEEGELRVEVEVREIIRCDRRHGRSMVARGLGGRPTPLSVLGRSTKPAVVSPGIRDRQPPGEIVRRPARRAAAAWRSS